MIIIFVITTNKLINVPSIYELHPLVALLVLTDIKFISYFIY